MNTKSLNYFIYTFAIIGVVSILSSFNNQTQQIHSTVPESHVWEFSEMAAVSGRPKIYKLNKVTGEVILYEGEKVQPLN